MVTYRTHSIEFKRFESPASKSILLVQPVRPEGRTPVLGELSTSVVVCA